MCKENNNNDFIQQFPLILTCPYWALKVVVALLSMQGQKDLNYPNLCSKNDLMGLE